MAKGVAAGALDECQSSARGAQAAATAMSPAADAAGVSVDSVALPRYFVGQSRPSSAFWFGVLEGVSKK